jgi:ribosomal protein S18 acetylase RimI-like enzyme
MTDAAGTVVRVLQADEWQTWRDIRLRSLADAPEAFGSTLAREQGFTESDWLRWFTGVSVLATVDGVPAALGGGFRVRDGWMQVVAMWTDPAYRRRGLAVQVLDVVVAAARAEGRRLVLDVAQGNSAARTAYERYGFVATGESEPIREDTAARADLMVLPES